jgi:FAD/FMN-containing dehydrogenase
MTADNFYKSRRLPEPTAEHFPEDVVELEHLIAGRGGDADVPRVVVGGGQHLREQVIGEQTFEAVRTERCNHILKLDRESNLVRVEAGVRWSELRKKLREDGYSLHAYRPYPRDATLGGLLARRHPGQPHRLSGDIREGCVAMSAVAPTLGDYRYLEAPRKASGPDLRHLFIGGEGSMGVILNLTMSISKPFPGRLFEWDAPTAADAVVKMRELGQRGLHRAWCYWRGSEGRFQAAVHAPTRLLDAAVQRLRAHYGEQFEVGGEDAVRELRRELEAKMPDQRSGEGAERTVALTFSLAHLGEALDGLEGVRDIEILDWSAHAATAFVEFDEVPEDGWPLERWQHALDVRAIVGGPIMGRQGVVWPEWAQTLKSEFDKGRMLAVGP